MDGETNKYNLLEQMVLGSNNEPTDLPLSLLQSITNNFSEDRKIGSGGFADVYEGVLQTAGSVAVKRLSQAINMDENNFNKEVTNLIRVKHQNVVRFLGYCADTQGKVEKYGGKTVMADVQQRLLCFEFLPNGSLDEHLNNVASGGFEWRTYYQIIKGLCQVLESWSTRFQMSDGGLWSEHVRECAMIGLECLDCDPMKRPITRQIVERLDELDCTYGSIEINHSAIPVLDVYPLYIWFPFKSDKVIKRPVTLTNKTDNFIGVLIAPTNLDACSNLDYPYVWEQSEDACSNRGDSYMWEQSKDIKKDRKSSIFRRLEPHSSETIYMTMRKKRKLPQQAAGKGLFDVVMVAIKLEKDLKLLDQHWNNGTWMEDKSEDRLIRAKELGTVVHLATLRAAVSSYLARSQEVAAHQFIPRKQVGKHTDFYRMDVLQSKTWLLMGHHSNKVSIWNYETQDRVMKVEVKHLKEVKGLVRIYSVKFIAGEQWFAAGDSTGHVHVYTYTNFGAEKDKVKELEAYDPSISGVDNLDVSPKHTLLLTASSVFRTIKLWDWSQGWTCTRVINTHDYVVNLKFGPRDNSTIATSSAPASSNVVKVWDIHCPDAMATLEGYKFAFYTESESGHDFMATMISGYEHSYHAKIWDLQTMKHVHTLKLGWRKRVLGATMFCSHPTLPILAAIVPEFNNNMYEIVVWDVRTYRVVKRLEFIMDDILLQMVFNVTKNITSLLVVGTNGISIIEINVSTPLAGC